MAKHSKIVFNANTTTLIAKVKKKRDFPVWFASVFVDGNFAGGTLTLQASPDGGVTQTTLKDKNSQAVVLNAAAVVPIELAASSHNDDMILLYATLAGATSPSVNVTVFDTV